MDDDAGPAFDFDAAPKVVLDWFDLAGASIDFGQRGELSPAVALAITTTHGETLVVMLSSERALQLAERLPAYVVDGATSTLGKQAELDGE